MKSVLGEGNVTSQEGFLCGSDSKDCARNAGDLGSIPWRRKWQSTPVFLPKEFHGQRSLAGYSPGGLKELDKRSD